MRKVEVAYQIQDRIRYDRFACEYTEPGDISISWDNGVLNLVMAKGHDLDDYRPTYSKVYMTAISVQVTEIEGKPGGPVVATRMFNA